MTTAKDELLFQHHIFDGKRNLFEIFKNEAGSPKIAELSVFGIFSTNGTSMSSEQFRAVSQAVEAIGLALSAKPTRLEF